MPGPLTAEKFYDYLSDFYDEMTTISERYRREMPIFRSIVTKYKIKTALDAGCGTGLHSILLATLGVRTSSVDASHKMINVLKINAKKHHLDVKARAVRFENLTAKINDRFDAVFCLGNTIPHITREQDILKTINNFRIMLNPKGLLVLQILNYHRMFESVANNINILHHGNKIFIRFYTNLSNKIQFNILTLEVHNHKSAKSLKSVEHRLVDRDNLFSMLRKAGFKNIKAYGSMDLERFDVKGSKDLIVFASNP